MAVCKTVERSVSLGGSCAAWLPLVRECLSARGFQNIREDVSGLRLTADYDVSGIGGLVSVLLSPAASCGGTDVSVVVTAAPGCAAVEGGGSLW